MMSAFRIPATFSKFYCYNSEEEKKKNETQLYDGVGAQGEYHKRMKKKRNIASVFLYAGKRGKKFKCR